MNSAMILLELDKGIIGLLVVGPGSFKQSCHPYFGHVDFLISYVRGQVTQHWDQK